MDKIIESYLEGAITAEELNAYVILFLGRIGNRIEESLKAGLHSYLITVASLKLIFSISEKIGTVDNARMNSDFLSQKNKLRLEKVSKILEAGGNPYEGTKGSGASEKHALVPVEASKATRKKLEQLWKSGAHTNPKRNRTTRFRTGDQYPQSPFKHVKAAEQVLDGSLSCSFCGKSVSRVEATFGRMAPKLKFEDEVVFIPVNDFRIDTKIKVSSRKLVACPDHALQIQPTLDREGHVTQNNTQFYSLEDQ